MPVPISIHHSQTVTQPPALVRVVSREDILWNRPVFKAPPLVVRPPVFDAKRFAAEVGQLES